MHRRTFTAIAAASILAPAALSQTRTDPLLPPTLAELDQLSLSSLDGAATTLGTHLGPGPAVISFWATWCSPCLAEARLLARIRNQEPAEQLNIIGLNMDRDEVRASPRLGRFMQRAGMNYTLLHGTVAAYRAFNNPGEGTQIVLPRLYVFDAEGAPSAAFGYYDGAGAMREIARAIEAVLA